MVHVVLISLVTSLGFRERSEHDFRLTSGVRGALVAGPGRLAEVRARGHGLLL